MEVLKQVSGPYRAQPFFSVAVSTDPKNSNSNVIQVGRPAGRPPRGPPLPALFGPVSFLARRWTNRGSSCRPATTTSTRRPMTR